MLPLLSILYVTVNPRNLLGTTRSISDRIPDGTCGTRIRPLVCFHLFAQLSTLAQLYEPSYFRILRISKVSSNFVDDDKIRTTRKFRDKCLHTRSLIIKRAWGRARRKAHSVGWLLDVFEILYIVSCKGIHNSESSIIC